MKVQNVSSNQLSYKGYVSKSFKDYIYSAARNECLSILDNANKKCQKVDAQKVLNVKLLADGIIHKFSKYIENLEEHTGLKVLKCGSLNKLALDNPISNNRLNFCYPFVYQGEKALLSGEFLRTQSMKQFIPAQEDAGADTLAMLDKVADELESLPADDIDNKFLEFAEADLQCYAKKYGTKFWKRMKARKAAKEIDDYAQAIGVEPFNQVSVEEYIQRAKEIKENLKLKKIQEDEIKKGNNRLVNDILQN